MLLQLSGRFRPKAATDRLRAEHDQELTGGVERLELAASGLMALGATNPKRSAGHSALFGPTFRSSVFDYERGGNHAKTKAEGDRATTEGK